ncbi:uncharacterized protein FOMMEDRAFT_131430 [Fomitiporia mediterranea MF3/22]|uniref:uncharacterized protein n=1 Tax=Fomitiporia mediterranea (strain MF3/22) TaxID=694068 RepID=UPI0004408C37|nr:uncharacterized protein FOMMEDRAFT_131430 [Fomitiporia mediterranea MF3/22]EJD06497.1 hypothetical protein FOMMEDRAFT_131430 [Fomitiporia mediterranea MF3/22]
MAGIGLNLNSITENTSRLGARIQESFIEHTRDLAIARGPGAAYFDVSEDKVRNVRKQLDTNSDREKLDALKTLIALISKGRNVSDYFPSVVKNVASPNLEIRKLVYIFLLRYAETEPDLALLSINTFQRDLADPNPLIRAMALRVLSGINVPMVGNIVILSVKKCANDPSPYVRKAAALATIKCYSMDSGHLPSLIPIITTLLKDKSPLSIGSVAVAFQAICPTRLDLLHPHYRRLCRMLLDIDAWGQVSVLELLARYARSMLPRPVTSDSAGNKMDEGNEDVDPDLQLLLSASEPLLMSRNPSVVMAVSRVFFYLSPPSQVNKLVGPLLRLLSVSKEVEAVVLANILIIMHEYPSLFSRHYSRFFIRAVDLRGTKLLKLRILLKLLSSDNYQVLLREFVVYADDPDDTVVSDAIRAIGFCANAVPDSASHCLSALMEFIRTGSESAVSASVLVLKSLVQTLLQRSQASSWTGGHSPARIIADLAGRLDEIRHALARACIVWLVGQYSSLGSESKDGSTAENGGLDGVAWWAPDVLRRTAKTFSTEAPIVKLQVLTLAAKLLLLSSTYHHSIVLLTRYVFSLARYDLNYDVRDRARLLTALLVGIAPHLQHTNGSTFADSDAIDEGELSSRGGVVLRHEQVKLILFEGKLETQQWEPFQGNTNFASLDKGCVLGSLEVITGRPTGLDSSLRLPDWPEEGTDSSLRDSPEEIPSVPVTNIAGQQQRSIAEITGTMGGFGPSHATLKVGSPVVLTPTGRASPSLQGGTGGAGLWKNLDEFYEESDDETEDEDEESEYEGRQTHSASAVQAERVDENRTAHPVHNEEESDSSDEDDDTDNSDSSPESVR